MFTEQAEHPRRLYPLCGTTVDVVCNGELLVAGVVESVDVLTAGTRAAELCGGGLVAIEGHGHLKHDGRVYYPLTHCRARNDE